MAHRRILLVAAVVLVCCLPAAASTTSLADWCFNINGNWASPSGACNGGGSAPSSFDTTLTPGTNALGSATFLLGVGQSADAYMDYDLDFQTFGSFQDSGAAQGALPPGVSWELDDPNVSNIFGDFATDSLTNTNNVAAPGGPPTACCDVAWALGVQNPFSVAAFVTFTVSDTAPASGFYLRQTNFDVGDSIYLSATVTPVPEGSTLGMVLSGVGSLAFVGLWKRPGGLREFAR